MPPQDQQNIGSYLSKSLVDLLSSAGSHLGIPSGEIKNPQGQTVFPTNALERAMQGSDATAQQFAASFVGPGAKGKLPVAAAQARPMYGTNAAQEATKYLSHYKGDLFTAIKAIDGSPLWNHPQGIHRVAEIKNAIIDMAPAKEIEEALKIESDFRKQNGMTYSQYQSEAFGSRPSHPYGIMDWAEFFQQKSGGLNPPPSMLPKPGGK